MLRLLLVVVVTSVLPAFAGQTDEFHHGACKNYAHFFEDMVASIPDTSAVPDATVDVLSYDIRLDWSANDLQTPLIGEVHIRAVLLQPVDTVRLDGKSMLVTGISVDDNLQPFTPYTAQGQIPVYTGLRSIGDTLDILISYTHESMPDYGLHAYRGGTFSGQDMLPSNQLYTLGAPDYTRFWLPCHDNAFDKALMSVAVTVDEKYTVAANGTLDSTQWLPGSGRTIFYFSSRDPISTYLMVVHASEYTRYEDEYITAQNDTIPLEHFVWEVDSADGSTRYDAFSAFDRVPEMMHVLGTRFGEYPFEKYGMAVVQPFFYYAMEHQTMVTVNRTSTAKGNPDEEMFMHELFHQWMGDYVTPATWNDIWINEGAATWSEALWNEHVHGPDAYRIYMSDIHNDYLFSDPQGRRQPALYRDIPRPVESQSEIGYLYNYPLTYQKGALVWHMLRRVLGDSSYYGTMQKLIEDNAFGAVETKDVAQIFADENPDADIPMETFFDQWVYGASYPDIEVTIIALVVAQSGGNEAEFIVEVEQKGDSLFELPLDFERIDESGDTLRKRLIIPAERLYGEFVLLPVELYDPQRTTLNRHLSFIGSSVLDFDMTDVEDEEGTIGSALRKIQSDNAEEVVIPGYSTLEGMYTAKYFTVRGKEIGQEQKTLVKNTPFSLSLRDKPNVFFCNLYNGSQKIVARLVIQK